MTFPERVKRARTKRKISQHVLSTGAGMSVAYVAQVESGGIERPGYEAMVGLARTLQVPVAWLAEGEGEEPDWTEEPSPDTERATT